MDPQPIDLSPLGLSDRRRARMVGAVLARARVGVVQRTPLAVLAGWARPTLAAAAAITGLSLASLSWYATRPAAETRVPLTVADGLRVPGPVGEWMSDNRAPAEEDLLAQWDDAGPGER